jgi:ADP-ribose pyrophosphatase YjhB (NUDIX family)
MIKVAGILIYQGDDILLFRRSNKVRYNGNWSVAGGHIEQNEGPEEAAKREVFEETMISITGPINKIGTFQEDGRFAMYSRELDKKVVPVINEEHDSWGWFNKDKLPSPLAPYVSESIDIIYK